MRIHSIHQYYTMALMLIYCMSFRIVNTQELPWNNFVFVKSLREGGGGVGGSLHKCQHRSVLLTWVGFQQPWYIHGLHITIFCRILAILVIWWVANCLFGGLNFSDFGIQMSRKFTYFWEEEKKDTKWYSHQSYLELSDGTPLPNCTVSIPRAKSNPNVQLNQVNSIIIPCTRSLSHNTRIANVS